MSDDREILKYSPKKYKKWPRTICKSKKMNSQSSLMDTLKIKLEKRNVLLGHLGIISNHFFQSLQKAITSFESLFASHFRFHG